MELSWFCFTTVNGGTRLCEWMEYNSLLLLNQKYACQQVSVRFPVTLSVTEGHPTVAFFSNFNFECSATLFLSVVMAYSYSPTAVEDRFVFHSCRIGSWLLQRRNKRQTESHGYMHHTGLLPRVPMHQATFNPTFHSTSFSAAFNKLADGAGSTALLPTISNAYKPHKVWYNFNNGVCKFLAGT